MYPNISCGFVSITDFLLPIALKLNFSCHGMCMAQLYSLIISLSTLISAALFLPYQYSQTHLLVLSVFLRRNDMAVSIVSM
jgi:cyanate permease